MVTEECQALKQESNNDKGEQARHIVDDLIKIYCSAGLGMQEANKYRMRALCNVQIWQKSGKWDYLVPAEKDLQTACTRFRAASNSQA